MVFKLNRGNLEKLERSISSCEVKDVPLNPLNKVGEGSYVTIFKYNVREKPAALKLLKQQISKKKILEISSRLREIKHENVIGIRGYSIRPCAIIYELCELIVDNNCECFSGHIATICNGSQISS